MQNTYNTFKIIMFTMQNTYNTFKIIMITMQITIIYIHINIQQHKTIKFETSNSNEFEVGIYVGAHNT